MRGCSTTAIRRSPCRSASPTRRCRSSGGVTVARELRYDPIGNLEQVLSGATVLEEFVDRGAAGPQKLDHSTGGVTYDYDHRGRQTRAGSRIITYNVFDLPRSEQDGSSGSLYEYTAAGDRFRQTTCSGHARRSISTSSTSATRT
jgi:hypothetical protein